MHIGLQGVLLLILQHEAYHHAILIVQANRMSGQGTHGDFNQNVRARWEGRSRHDPRAMRNSIGATPHAYARHVAHDAALSSLVHPRTPIVAAIMAEDPEWQLQSVGVHSDAVVLAFLVCSSTSQLQ